MTALMVLVLPAPYSYRRSRATIDQWRDCKSYRNRCTAVVVQSAADVSVSTCCNTGNLQRIVTGPAKYCTRVFPDNTIVDIAASEHLVWLDGVAVTSGWVNQNSCCCRVTGATIGIRCNGKCNGYRIY